MKCDFRFTGEVNDAGWKRARCSRCGLLSSWTPHPTEKIHAACNRWPWWWEFGHWLGFILDAVGVTRARVKAVADWLGIPCDCDGRKRVLNRLGWFVNLGVGWLFRGALKILPR